MKFYISSGSVKEIVMSNCAKEAVFLAFCRSVEKNQEIQPGRIIKISEKGFKFHSEDSFLHPDETLERMIDEDIIQDGDVMYDEDEEDE